MDKISKLRITHSQVSKWLHIFGLLCAISHTHTHTKRLWYFKFYIKPE